MVDPNRKINRLADKNLTFLEQCELEFTGRFTEDDPDFMAHCSKPLPDPPIVENWMSGGGGGAGGSGVGGRRDGGFPYKANRFNGHQGPQRGGDRGWHRRGGGGYHNNHDRGFRDNRRNNRYDYRDNRRDHTDGGGGGGGERERDGEAASGAYKRSYDRSSHDRNEPPIKVRRDYGNFVPASKD